MMIVMGIIIHHDRFRNPKNKQIILATTAMAITICVDLLAEISACTSLSIISVY